MADKLIVTICFNAEGVVADLYHKIWENKIGIELSVFIEDEKENIILSNGAFTAEGKYCVRNVSKTAANGNDGKENLTFNFASNKMESNTEDMKDIMSGHVKRAIKRIHYAGGCDAQDEYSKGYDDAITLALNILLEETGYVFEGILD